MMRRPVAVTHGLQGGPAEELGSSPEHPIPVARAVPRVAAIVEERCGRAHWFIGELSSLRRGRASWAFGSVSDGAARLDVRFPPHAEQQVGPDAVGRLLVFKGALRLDRAGSLSVTVIEAQTVDAHGARVLAREELRRRLTAEGVFMRRTRPLPEWPVTVAIVTAASGAAVEDIRTAVRRRAPWTRLVIHDSPVQGPAAPAALACALARASSSGVGVIVLARGGGAAENLAAFDTEPVVRAMLASNIPVVCAVGHQTDRTLADDVADLSVATPTAAAERITPDRTALASQLEQIRCRLHSVARRYVHTKGAELRSTTRRAMPAATRLMQLLESRLNASSPEMLRQRAHRSIDTRRKTSMDALARCERSAGVLIRVARSELKRARQRLQQGMKRSTDASAVDLRHQWERITALSPEAILERGYAIVQTEVGACRAAAGVVPGATVHIHFGDGVVTAKVTNITLQSKGRAA